MGSGMGFSMWLFWGAVIFIVALAVRAVSRTDTIQSTNSQLYESSLEILKKRYASGEIDTDEFERMKIDLEI